MLNFVPCSIFVAVYKIMRYYKKILIKKFSTLNSNYTLSIFRESLYIRQDPSSVTWVYNKLELYLDVAKCSIYHGSEFAVLLISLKWFFFQYVDVFYTFTHDFNTAYKTSWLKFTNCFMFRSIHSFEIYVAAQCQ